MALALLLHMLSVEPSLDGSVELCTVSGSGDGGAQGSTKDIIKTQINGHNLERDRVWCDISLVSATAWTSKQCKQ